MSMTVTPQVGLTVVGGGLNAVLLGLTNFSYTSSGDGIGAITYVFTSSGQQETLTPSGLLPGIGAGAYMLVQADANVSSTNVTIQATSDDVNYENFCTIVPGQVALFPMAAAVVFRFTSNSAAGTVFVTLISQ
jgi:hypothetical protein